MASTSPELYRILFHKFVRYYILALEAAGARAQMLSTLRHIQQALVGFRHGQRRLTNDSPSIGHLLPTELWLMILFYIKGRSDLSALCRTSKWFRMLIESQWYASLSIATTRERLSGGSMVLEDHKQDLLLRTLRTPRIGKLVTEFRINLPWCTGSHGMPMLGTFLQAGNCSCAELDRRLGKALVSLPRLQVLYIKCLLCNEAGDTPRHLYLAKLPTTGLREFSLQCRCIYSRPEKSQRILSAPCFASVTTLDWRVDGGQVQPTIYDGGSRTFTETIPLVSKLRYGRTVDFSGIISSRAITHLGCHMMTEDLHYSLVPFAGHLIQLRVDENWISLTTYMKQHPEPYRALKHFGCLQFTSSRRKAIVEQMLPFSTLQKLESIEILSHAFNHYTEADTENHNPWDKALLVELNEKHHSLEKVYIKNILRISKRTGETCEFFLWEKLESWQRHTIAPFTDWDMVIGFEHRAID